MAERENPFVVRSKIWLEDSSGRVVFGLGRCRILAAIDRCGSMNLAAADLAMSYRAVWCRIRESEKRLERKLVIRKGKGSVLTPFAQGLLQQFAGLNLSLQGEADRMFGNLFDPATDRNG